uniref:Uncharacterized protein n=1 Tax=Solanum lycopersicum TaxID=4081 RepID=A0A3Q7ERE2_SOLLC
MGYAKKIIHTGELEVRSVEVLVALCGDPPQQALLGTEMHVVSGSLHSHNDHIHPTYGVDPPLF